MRLLQADDRHMHHQKSIPALAFPMILANLTIPLLGAVDTAVLGYLDHPAYLAGASISINLFGFLFGLLGFLRMGTTGYTAQAYGAKEWESVQHHLSRALVSGAALGVILLCLTPLLYYLLLPILTGNQADAGSNTPHLLHPHAETYLSWRILGAPVTLMNMAILGWLIGLQRVKTALFLQLAQNLLNIGLDILLVHYWDQQVAGVAIATILSESLIFCLSLVYIRALFRHSQYQWLSADIIDFQAWQDLFRTNRDLFVRSFLLSLSMIIMTGVSSRQGSLFVAGNAILMNLFLFASYALDGFAHAAEIQVGYAIGQNKISAIKNAIRKAFLWSLIMALGLSCLIGLGGWLWIKLLTELPEVRTMAVIYLPWLVLTPLIGAPAFILDGIFIGATQTSYLRQAMIKSSLVYAVAIISLPVYLGGHGIWCAFILLLAARSVFLFPYLANLQKNQRKTS